MERYRTSVAARAGVMALILGAAFAVNAQAETLALPELKDAAQAALLKEANAEYQTYAAAGDSYFKSDAAKGDWPCKIDAVQLNALAGTTDYKSSAGGKEFGHAYSDVVIHPISAACKNGKLDGKVEFVYEATRKAWGPGFENSERELGKVTATLRKGKLKHRLEVRKASDVADAAKLLSVTASAEKPAGAFITSATVLLADGAQKYFLKRPVAGKRLEKSFYIGTALVSVEQQDAKGNPDGSTLAYKDGQASKTCFKHGKPLDAGACGK